MSRFDIGVVVVTFVALGLIALIRGVVAPIVRLRVARYRGSGNLAAPNDDPLQRRDDRIPVKDANR